MNALRLLIASLTAFGALSAAAQEVKRCEGADGKVSYANGPCPPGTAAVRSLPAAGTPSAADQKAAQQRAQQDVRNAAALDRARKAEEDRATREQSRQLAAAMKQETHCRSLQTSIRHAQEDLAGARPRKRTEMQRRLARAEDAYRGDCGPVKN